MGAELRCEGFDAGVAGFKRLRSESTGLHRQEAWPRTGMTIVRVELALKELPDKSKAVGVLAQADEIGEKYLLEARG